MDNCLKWSARIRRGSVTTGLIADAYFMLQETVKVLSDPE